MTVAREEKKHPAEPKGGKDGKEIEAEYAEQLTYLRKLAGQLGVRDVVDEFFTPVLGRWSDLHAEAEQWRAAAASTEEVTEALHKPLGKLDGSWDGEAADSFIDYMGKVGLAGKDMSDAMTTMGTALDDTADGVREIVTQLAGVLGEAAETSSSAMALPVLGDERTRQYLELMRPPVRELHESVRQVLEAFGTLCGQTDGSGQEAFASVELAHEFPEHGWNFGDEKPEGEKPEDKPAEDKPADDPVDEPADEEKTDDAATGASGGSGGAGGGAAGGGSAGAAASQPPTPGVVTGIGDNTGGSAVPEAPAAASAGGAGGSGAAAGRGGHGMPMMPMMPMGAAGGAGGNEHKSHNRLVGDPSEIFGKPEKTSTPVLGSDD